MSLALHKISTLPSTLLDLTMIRLANPTRTRTVNAMGGLGQWQRSFGCRKMHQATAMVQETPADLDHVVNSEAITAGLYKAHGLLAIRGEKPKKGLHPLEELERRVQALDEAIKTDSLAFNPLSYTEEELLAIYEDVLAVPLPQAPEQDNKAAMKAVQKAQAEEDMNIIEGLERRLCDGMNADGRPYRRLLTRAHEIISRAEAARNMADPNTESNYDQRLPMGLLSIRECEALVRESMKAGDGQAAEVTLDIMKRDNMTLPENAITDILQLYSKVGNTEAADRLLSNFLREAPTELQRHLHVQTHLKGASITTFPSSALELLHHYENQNVPAPMHTYTSVIASLLSRSSARAKAQAWDTFTHMRYVAHPKPDEALYTLMIRACASPVTTRYTSEPEKALDLWIEMTVDQNLRPTVATYNAVILACARSGSKKYVNEAFRLARQMLDSQRDARGISAFRPDKKTFCALLEGTKRIGDLGRARWILAEMVRGGGDGVNSVEAEIDEEVMMHIFHAYAAYNPPFLRSSTALVVETAEPAPKTGSSGATPTYPSSEMGTAVQASGTTQLRSSTSLIEDENQQPSFAHIPPQTRTEIIREVKILFNRILHDHSETKTTATASLPFAEKKFKNVQFTTRLLTSYLSVFYRHASLDTSREMFWRLFEDLKLTRSPRTFVEALERCANARRGDNDRKVALRFADELWSQWQAMEMVGHADGKVLNPRFVERAHVAMIRVLSLTEETSRAISHLRAFAAKYPPSAVRTPSPKLPLQSTRTSLVGARPLVRMTSAAELPDDNVPPLVTFRDIEILHHRLVDEERMSDIKYITWLCKAYEWALRVRRDEAIKAKVTQDQGVAVVA